MTTPACPSYVGYRFPAEIISHAVWLYFRFPLSLRMVDELLAARSSVADSSSPKAPDGRPGRPSTSARPDRRQEDAFPGRADSRVARLRVSSRFRR